MGAKKPTADRPPAGTQKPLPTKDAPFQIDPNDDGDMVSPRRELTEEEIKEQADRRR